MFEQQVLNQITVNTHSSIRIGGESVIYIDPLKIRGAPHDADLILITHPHIDHFSLVDIKKVMKSDTVIAGPYPVAMLCKSLLRKNAVAVVPGQKLSICNVQIETVAAYNLKKPIHLKFFKWVGYVLTQSETRIYISGDTDATEESRIVSCDIAMVPIGGIFTMNAAQAAELVNQIQPHTVIPLHYGAAIGGKAAPEQFCARLQNGIEADIRSTVYNYVVLIMMLTGAVLAALLVVCGILLEL